ncbi:hypothetical protein HN814_00510 [Candidatus Woesearchaeota archaeon]|nr:hypothetical protein [Candidatus Woesearchaeota archaeon]
MLTISSKNKISYTILILIILIGLTCNVTALSEDFWAFSNQKTVNMCACELKEEWVTIQNTGDITSSYLIESNGEYGKWTTQAPNFLILEPGEKQNIQNFINIPCSARGEYEVGVMITTALGLEKELIQTLDVKNCPNVEIVQKFDQTLNEGVCPCTPMEYTFEIYNTGKHSETYNLKIEEEYSKYFTLSANQLIVEPGQLEVVQAFINLPCEIYGQQNVTLSVLTESSKVLGETEVALNINKCYDYKFINDPNYSACQNAANYIPIQIENQADFSNTYSLELVAPEWTNLENSSLKVYSGETEFTNLLAIPTKDHNETYEVIILGESDKGDEQKNTTLQITPENCYDYELVYGITVENADLYSIYERTEEQKVLVQNSGTKELIVQVELSDAPEWVTLKGHKEFEIGPEEFKEITLKTETPPGAKKEYEFNLNVNLLNLDNETRQTPITLGIVNAETAYDVEVIGTEEEIQVLNYEATGREITIKNDGMKSGKYHLELEANPWVTLDTNVVEISPMEGQIINVNVAPTEDVAEMLYKATLYMTVEGEDLTYAHEFNVRVGEKSPLENLYWILGGALLLLIIVLVIVLLLLGRKSKTEELSYAEPSDDEYDMTQYEGITTQQTKSIETKTKKEKIGTVRYPGQTSEKETKTRYWWILWLLLGLVTVGAILGGIIFLAMYQPTTIGNQDNQTTDPNQEITDGQEDLITKETAGEQLIQLDGEGIINEQENAIIVNQETEPITMPITIKNPTDETAIFKVEAESDWITFDKTLVQVQPQTTKTIDITITPDYELLQNNNYNVVISGEITGDKIEYADELSVDVQREKKYYEKISFWIILGIIILLTTILIIHLIRNRTPTEEKEITIKDVNKRNWKWLIWLIGILVIVGLLGLGIYGLMQLSNTNSTPQGDLLEGETDTITIDTEDLQDTESESQNIVITEDNSQEELIQLDLNGYGDTTTIQVVDETELEISLVIKNPTDKKAIFSVKTQETSWATPEKEKLIINENSETKLILNIQPDYEELKEMDHKIQINGKISGEKIDYDQTVDVTITKQKNKFLTYLIYAGIGIIILVILIILIELVKRRKKEEEEELEDTKDDMIDEITKLNAVIDKEPEKKKAKTKTKKKSKKTETAKAQPEKKKRTSLSLKEKE